MSAPAANPVLQQLATSVVHLGVIIEAPLWALPTFGYPTTKSYPYVLDEGGRFVWGVQSGDFLLERRETDRAEEILYWIFEHITRSMVTSWRSGAGVPNTTGDDWPAKQHALLGRLTPRWAARFAQEHEGWLDLGTGPAAGRDAAAGTADDPRADGDPWAEADTPAEGAWAEDDAWAEADAQTDADPRGDADRDVDAEPDDQD